MQEIRRQTIAPHQKGNSFCKKLEKFRAAVATNLAYYNFCRIRTVANKKYIERLQMVIRQLHKCDAEHTGTEPVKEVFRGETVWEGDVEVFNVTGHPRAKRAYAWSEYQGTLKQRFTAVLEIRPVKSALDAVKVSIVAGAKKEEE